MENQILQIQMDAKDFQLKLILEEANLLLISISPEGFIEYIDGRVLKDQQLNMLDFLGQELQSLAIVPLTKAFKQALQNQEVNTNDTLWNNQTFNIKSRIERDDQDQSIRRVYLLIAPSSAA